MRKLTSKEVNHLGRDLKEAKIKVLKDWGFSNEEIARIMDTGETVIEKIIDKVEESK